MPPRLVTLCWEVRDLAAEAMAARSGRCPSGGRKTQPRLTAGLQGRKQRPRLSQNKLLDGSPRVGCVSLPAELCSLEKTGPVPPAPQRWASSRRFKRTVPGVSDVSLPGASVCLSPAPGAWQVFRVSVTRVPLCKKGGSRGTHLPVKVFQD